MVSAWVRSFAELALVQPSCVTELRCATVRVAVSTWVRYTLKCSQLPLSTLAVADVRRPVDERLAMGTALLAMSRHDLDPGFWAIIRESISEAEDLLHPRIQDEIFLAARILHLHTQAVEDRHAEQRNFLGSSSEWKRYCARAVNGESTRWIPPPAAALAADSKRTRKRNRTSDLDQTLARGVPKRFHAQCAERDAGSGSGFNPVSSAYWDQVKREWFGDG